MQYIEKSYVHEFLFDLEFIYDVKHLSRCRIWEICVYSCRTMQVFHRVIDPNPKMSVFPEPPLKSIPRLTRDFLSSEGALPFSAVFPMVIEWIHDQLRQTPGAIPVLISHNTFRSDKPILENEYASVIRFLYRISGISLIRCFFLEIACMLRIIR